MAIMRLFVVSAVISVIAAVSASDVRRPTSSIRHATSLSQPANAQRGLAKGAAAPAIEMLDQFGRLQTLQSLAGEKGLVLLFVRSADW